MVIEPLRSNRADVSTFHPATPRILAASAVPGSQRPERHPNTTPARRPISDPAALSKSIPASVRAAAVALESELIDQTDQPIRTGFEQVKN